MQVGVFVSMNPAIEAIWEWEWSEGGSEGEGKEAEGDNWMDPQSRIYSCILTRKKEKR